MSEISLGSCWYFLTLLLTPGVCLFQHQPVLWCQLGVQQFSSDVRSQSCKWHPRRPTLLPAWLQILGLPGCPLRFDNLLEWHTELRKTLHLYLPVSYKAYFNSGMAKWKRCVGQGMGWGGGRGWEVPQSFHDLSGCVTTLPALQHVRQPGSSQNLIVQEVFFLLF